MSKKPLKAICGSSDKPLIVGNIEILCYVLADETRVIAQRGMFNGLGMGASRGSNLKNGHSVLCSLVDHESLRRFISDGSVEALRNPIEFQPPIGGRTAYGYQAKLLADICEAVLQAKSAHALPKKYAPLAKRCDVLIRGFARIGIIGLIDEATGYQEVRAKNALAAILEKFLTEEVQKWTKTFPLEFYEEIYRLKSWDWPVAPVGRKPPTPQLIGRYTNEIVYDRLAPGVLDELKTRNPRGPSGARSHKHHQWFTPDFGHPRLKEHLSGVLALMRASSDWKAFQRLLKRSYPKKGDQSEIL